MIWSRRVPAIAALWVICVQVLLLLILPQTAQADDFHVSTPWELENALTSARDNGRDDTIYVAAGTYIGRFTYTAFDGMSLTLRAEPGITAEQVILDAQSSGGSALRLVSATAEACRLTVQDLTLQHADDGGLRILCDNGSLDVLLNHLIVQHNSGRVDGGGILIDAVENASVRVQVQDTIVRHNQAPGANERGGRGAGIAVEVYGGNSSAELIMVNSLIYGNHGNWPGGGLELAATGPGQENAVRAVLVNTTITGNRADTWGGSGIDVYAGRGSARATLEMYNSIVYGNPFSGEQPWHDLWVETGDADNTSISAYHCDIGHVISPGGVYEPFSVISQDPGFVDPASDDYHLSRGSPCIDAGTASVPEPPGLPAMDFEGDPRTIGPAPDIGADEYGFFVLLFLPIIMRH
jgi:hypothetical protein